MMSIRTNTLEQDFAVAQLLAEHETDPTEVERMADGDLIRIRFEDEGGDSYIVWSNGECQETLATDEEIIETQQQRALHRKIRLYRELVNLLIRTSQEGGSVATAIRVWSELDADRSFKRFQKLELLDELELNAIV